MAIYWFPSQLPELQNVPHEAREEIVEMGLHTIPITWWNVFTCCVTLFPVVAAGLALTIHYGAWVKYADFLVALPVVWVWWLNTARPRIREIVQHLPQTPSRVGNR
jgi:hypothetical protein